MIKSNIVKLALCLSLLKLIHIRAQALRSNRRNDIIKKIRRMTRGSSRKARIVSDSGCELKKDVLEKFRKIYSLKRNSVSVYTCDDENEFPCGEYCYSLQDGEVVRFKGTYRHNNIEEGIPSDNGIYQQTHGSTILTYKIDSYGEVSVAVMTNREDGSTIECPRIQKGYFASIRQEDYDNAALNESFVFDEIDEDDFHESVNDSTIQRRRIMGKCEEFRKIDVAVVYESSFCKKSDHVKETADQEAMYLIELASQRYQQDGLCIKLKISHLEGYCDVSIDPFKIKDHSGCGKQNFGLLDEFERYWNDNRKGVKRDVAHLLSGTKMQSSNGVTFVGCANTSTTCDKSKAYGVSQTAGKWANKINPYVFRSTLVAHELGHNNGVKGKKHDLSKDYIMHKKITGAPKGFSDESIALMQYYLNSQNCVEIEKLTIVTCDNGSEYRLSNEEVNLVHISGTYRHNNVEYEDGIPSQNHIFQDIKGDEVLTYKTDSNGKVEVAVKVDREQGNIIECIRTQNSHYASASYQEYTSSTKSNNIFVFNKIDEDDLNEATGEVKPTEHRVESRACNEFRQIDVAIVYDSPFCIQNGRNKEKADREAMYLIELVSQLFQQRNLCIKLRLSHLEGYCDPSEDPFETSRNMLCRNRTGLLYDFEDYWNNSRKGVRRGVAYLLTGRNYVDDGKIPLGCSFTKSTCHKTRAYSVSFAGKDIEVSFGSYRTRCYVIAHELGHNNGCIHDFSTDDYIMSQVVNTAAKGFSTESISQMNQYLNSQECFVTIGSPDSHAD